MKVMIQLNSREISRLQYPVVVEMWGKRLIGIKNRAAWASTFSEEEQRLAEKFHTLFRHWYIPGWTDRLSGPPREAFNIPPRTYTWLTNKLIPFFATLT